MHLIITLLSVLLTSVFLTTSSPITPHRRAIPGKIDANYTRGALCTPNDPHYMGEFYGIHKCERNFSAAKKNAVARFYGVVKEEFGQYEFDHLEVLMLRGCVVIPLGIGGSNDVSNVWPQPGPSGQNESGLKNVVEFEAYNRLSKGLIKQAQNYGTTYTLQMYGL
ncbi:hypothetical protein HDU67_006219 [Dinochytrium kinnereticum]|nr:hypothetical protein HDU67_006219 [Dinochytrium kinnereticum]